jgi:glycosyltransferase involved in cell wall biosynthesis
MDRRERDGDAGADPGSPGRGSIIALVPAYDEAPRIGEVVVSAGRYLPVLVVDDGSTDGTAAAAESAGAIVVRQTPNRGKGVALRAGLRWALERRCRAVVTLDADGQHDPGEIPVFLAAHSERDADLVIGERSFDDIPPLRRLANMLGRWSFSWAVGRPIPDNQSGYRLLSRRMMAAVLDISETGFEFEVAMIAACVRRGFRLEWVPIRAVYAGERSHIDPLRHAIGFTRMVWRTRRVMRSRVNPRARTRRPPT